MSPESPETPSPRCEKAKELALDHLQEFKEHVEQADIEVVGKDTEYEPDAPRLRESHPNVDDE